MIEKSGSVENSVISVNRRKQFWGDKYAFSQVSRGVLPDFRRISPRRPKNIIPKSKRLSRSRLPNFDRSEMRAPRRVSVLRPALACDMHHSSSAGGKKPPQFCVTASPSFETELDRHIREARHIHFGI